MPIALTDDHRELARIARDALTSRDVLGLAHAALDAPADDAPVRELAHDLGWLGLHLPEEVGGQGGSLAELVVVVEELGRVVAPGALLPTLVASSVWPDARLVDGSHRATVALDGALALTDGRVSGTAGPVLAGELADLLLLTVGADVVVVRASDAHVDVHLDVDATRSLGTVTCSDAPVVEALPGAAAALRRAALTLAAAEAVGGMAACLDASVAYAKVREQFGRPVGSFMAVKHHCAGMLVDLELATAAVWDAVQATASDGEAELVAAVAASAALPAFERLARLTIQLHGGIAFTWEHTAHLWLRRAMSLAVAFGRVPLTEVTDLVRAGAERHAAVELPPEAEDFRLQARTFVDAWFATDPADRARFTARSGYVVPHWPTPWGRGAGAVEQLVLEEELRAVDRVQLGLGGWVLPAILSVATPEQAERWVWPALEGLTRWCQLFSEPGAGSDAASVQTRGVRVEGGWRVTGQKVWSSDAAHCQWGLATIRTDPEVPKHQGITTMAIDLSATGVSVRPLREITGASLFNEVWLDDVFVPDADVVGEPGAGWSVTMSTLGLERVSIGGDVSSLPAEELVGLLDRHAPGDVGLAREVGAQIARHQALQALSRRSAVRAVAAVRAGAEGTVAKLAGAEHQQAVTELGLRIAGPAALLGQEPRLVRDSLYTRCLTIAGGTSEIVRTSIAERILGLPR